MSTEHQRYSIDNQMHVIAEHATAHELEIVRTYADAGRSGLTFEGRNGLRQLIDDVKAGPPFETLLVYDVSRWGRFQDTDEAAYYEFVCRKQGVQVVYVAEPFENDGTPLSAVVKSLKRAMAAEYSRDLGRKVHLGQTRLAERGLWQGGVAPYGYSRCVVSETGERRHILAEGQRKGFLTDRIILVPGPPHEVATVKRIFELYVYDQLFQTQIADLLNFEHVPARHGGRWWSAAIAQIIRSPIYVGDLCYNKRTSSLTPGRVRKREKDRWTIVQNAFEPLIERKLFETARKVRATRRPPAMENEEILKRLRATLDREGYLSAGLIESTPGLPSVSVLLYRFGSLRDTYRLIGYSREGRINQAAIGFKRGHALRQRLRLTFIDALEKRAIPYQDESFRTFVVAGERIRVIPLMPAPQKVTPRWKSYAIIEPNGLNVFARMGADDSVIDYFVIPGDQLENSTLIIGRQTLRKFSWYRADTLDPLLERLSAKHSATARPVPPP